MKIAIFYDKSKPSVDLVYATTNKIEVELEKVILDIQENENILQAVCTHLGVEYEEPKSNCEGEDC